MTLNFSSHTLCSLSALLAILILPLLASGQCAAPITIAVVTTGSSTQNCLLDPVTGRWNVTVTLNGPVTSNNTVTIRGGSSLLLGRVTIQNNTSIDCRVNILGSGFDQRIGGVGFIDRGTSGANRVLLLQLYTTGDVGYDRPGNAAINVDMISNLSIGGSVIGSLVSNGSSRSMHSIFIQGDLIGGISLAVNSSIDSIWVGGALGRAIDPPVQLMISGNIGGITAGSINADINTLQNGAAGTVHAIETTLGGFKGSLTCHRLFTVPGAAGNPRFMIAGDLDAGMTITRDIRLPIHVGGTFTSSRLINNVPVANTIFAGTGAFDYPNADPSATITVEGNLDGALSLGPPLTSGLGSINRNIIINGELTGSITSALDIDANITINGGVSGRIMVNGTLRSGRAITTAGPLTSTGLISIGSSLLGTINCPPNGLQGQVVVNAGNIGGVWSGPVLVGGINPFANAPYYTSPSSTLGGGSVGLVPFRANLADCTPAHNTPGNAGFVGATAFEALAATPVLIRLYGPVQPLPGFSVAAALVIEQLVGGSWVDRMSYFTPGFQPVGASSSRIISLSRSAGASGNPPTGQYRVRAVALQSAGVAGTPSAVWPEPYLFRIDADCDGNGQTDSSQIAANPILDQNADGILDSCQTPPSTCTCDADHSGALTIQDIFTYLGEFFNNTPAADFDGSGNISIQDVFSFIACFFDPPPGC